MGASRVAAETRAVLFLILLASLVRVGFAFALGLGVDESYMVATGRVLRLGYFDHPPASWWMQWAAAHLLGTEAPLAVRAPFILAFALSTWLMYRLGAAVADRRVGVWAAVALNLSPVFGVTTGTWVLPDGPLDCALLGAALCLIHALPARGRPALGWWCGAGVCAGLALFSKYTALLTIGGAFLYLLTAPTHRRWLARPEPYLAGLVAVAVFSPVVAWNATHHWASFAFQGDRAAGLQFRPGQPFVVLSGEALFVLPWIWLPMMAAFVAALRQGPADWRTWLLCCLGAPPIVAFVLIAGWSSQRVLFHWAAPGYLMLFPLLGAWIAAWLRSPGIHDVRLPPSSSANAEDPRLASASRRGSRGWSAFADHDQEKSELRAVGITRRTLIATVAFVLVVIAIVSTQVRLDWLHPAIAAVARHDPDLEAIDWTSLRGELASRGLLAPGAVIGVPDWRDAGKVAYALGPEVTVVCLNRDARQFGFDDPASDFIGHDMLILAFDHPARALRALTPVFAGVDELPSAAIRHRGHVLEGVALFQGHRLRAWPPP